MSKIPKLLKLEILTQTFSLNNFNITFFISNETGHGVAYSKIQMWWDGINVSEEVVNLGGGSYSISLGSITVASGEDPILLNMTVLVNGYEDKYFETYLSVRPCDLIKTIDIEIIDQLFSTEGFNITFSISIFSKFFLAFSTRVGYLSIV